MKRKRMAMLQSGEMITFYEEVIICPECGVNELDLCSPGVYSVRCIVCDSKRLQRHLKPLAPDLRESGQN